MKRSLLFFSICLLFFAFTGKAATPWLHVDGNKIKDPAGNVVILRGVALQDIKGQADDKTVGLNGFIDRLTDLEDTVAESPGWYTRVVRFTIAPPIADLDKYYTETLKPAVDYATSKGLYVIIDWHYIADVNGNIQTTNEFWSYVAPRFNNYSNVLYEVYNEPINQNLTWGQFKPYMQAWVDLIRRYAPHNLILAGNPMWDQKMGDAATNPLSGNNIVYVAHIYPGHWGTGNSQVKAQVEKAAAVHPVFLSEWGFSQGATDKLLQGTITSYGKPIVDWAEKLGLSWTAWVADNDWQPTMFTRDWKLKVGEGEMGGYTKDKLYELRDDHQPTDVACLAPFLGLPQTLCGKTSLSINTGITQEGVTFKWFKDGTEVSDVASSLEVTETGIYKVEVSNGACTMSDEVIIVDTIFPVHLGGGAVTTQPVLVKSDLEEESFSYEWYHNGQLIEGADSSSIMAFDTCGSYYALKVISETCGSVTDTFWILCKRGLFKGKPFDIPGIIEAEDYDYQNVLNTTYYDSDPSNQGGAYRNDQVDIEATKDTKGKYNVGWTAPNEWMEYSISVKDSGLYPVYLRVAGNPTPAVGATVHIRLNNVKASSTLTLPVTGDWQKWETVFLGNVTFKTTDTLLRFYIETSGFNLNYIEVGPKITGLFSKTEPSSMLVYPNPSNSLVYFSQEVPYNWTVSTILGNELLNGFGTNADISSLPKGTYLLNVEGSVVKILKY